MFRHLRPLARLVIHTSKNITLGRQPPPATLAPTANKSKLLSAFLPNQVSSYSTTKSFDYETVSFQTLDSLCEFFDDLAETYDVSDHYDVIFDNGVLTVKVSKEVGTYVLNKQSPNRQIWLSSPVSGPKRYDFVDGGWKHLRDGSFLHDLIKREFSEIFKDDVSMANVAHRKPGS